MIVLSVDTRVDSSLIYCREYTILFVFFFKFVFLGEISYTATLVSPRRNKGDDVLNNLFNERIFSHSA